MGFKRRDTIDRLAREAAGIEPDDPRAPALAAGLARGFFEPRPEHLALDVARAQAILIGGEGLPALSDGDPWRWGPRDRPHHIDLPEGVVHPAATALWARQLGWSARQVEALLAAEIYVGEAGDPRLWPWYPEQDAELGDAAAARAADLGANLPERMLDDPFESSWYWKRTGPEGLEMLLARRGLEIAELAVRAVPVLELGPQLEWEGGGRAPSLAEQQARAISDLARQLEHTTDPEYRTAMLAGLSRALARYVAAVRGDPQPPISIPALEVAGAVHALSDQRPALVTLRAVWAIERGAAVACDGALIICDDSGERVAAWPCPVMPWFCGGRIALVDDGEPHALDLETGEWITGRLDPLETFGGALSPVATDPGLGFAGSEALLSPDGRYRLELDHGIQRMGDAVWVAGDEVFGHWYDDDDEEAAEPAPELFDPAALEAGGVVVTTIDGVAFAARRRQSFQVRGGERPVAFVLAGDRWRALIERSLRINDREIARLPVACHAAAFSPGGRRLWILTGDHLLRIDWHAGPELGAVAPLEPIAAAAREVLE